MSPYHHDEKPNARSANHGGIRKGAGRKPGPDGAEIRRRLMINERLYAKAVSAGRGNASAGVRIALEKHSEPVALFTSPDWDELMSLFTTYGTEGHEMRCQKHDGVWFGQVYEVTL